MGIFSGPPSLETRLVTEYTRAFQLEGMTHQEATKTASNMVAQAKEEVTQRGWSNQPPNYGDVLLQSEAADPAIHEALEARRNDGVRNEDIQWWWNMHPLERVMLAKADEMNWGTAFLEFGYQGLTPAEAAKRVFQIHPQFGDPRQGEGDDRPIPIELKRRIVEYIERHYTKLDQMKEKTKAHTSFNALIRAEIRAGNV